MCDDGKIYVVKACQTSKATMGHSMVAEQVVARVGRLIGAPVPEVALVDVPAALISAQAEMSHMNPGIAHGSKFMDGVSERMAIDHMQVPENRDRFGRLAVLYGWMVASDHQFLYNKTGPPLVHSVDHGHFFPGGPGWTVASLASAPVAHLDDAILNPCALTPEEKENAASQIRTVQDCDLREIADVPPAHWGLTEEERTALKAYLSRRRDEIMATFPRG
jgi:hypothetical protein